MKNEKKKKDLYNQKQRQTRTNDKLQLTGANTNRGCETEIKRTI